MSAKTEQPSPRRLRKAREQGDIPVSAALVQGAALLGAVLLVPAAAAALAGRSAAHLRAALAGEPPLRPLELAFEVVALGAPLLLAAAVAASLVGVAQTGGQIATRRLTPDLSRLSIAAGVQGLFNLQRLVAVARAAIAAGLVLVFSGQLLLDHARDLAHTTGSWRGALAVSASLVDHLLWIAVVIAIALGLVDVLVTRRAWLNRHRMTKQEVKQEARESEGDPEIKAARRRAHHEALAGAMLSAVKTATVVVVNPTHLATALHYDQDQEVDGAPVIVAQGRGELARQIVQAAHAYGVPVVRDVPLAQALKELEPGDEIPEALYEAVAEILREVWQPQATPSGPANSP